LNGKDLCDEDAGVFGLMAIFVYQDCGAISKFIKGNETILKTCGLNLNCI